MPVPRRLFSTTRTERIDDRLEQRPEPAICALGAVPKVPLEDRACPEN